MLAVRCRSDGTMAATFLALLLLAAPSASALLVPSALSSGTWGSSRRRKPRSVLPSFAPRPARPSRRHSSASCLSMCICIDCAHVTNCKAYHFVEEQHKQAHMNVDPTWEPRNGSPTIHANVRTVQDDAVVAAVADKLEREHESETEKAEAKAKAEGRNVDDDAPLVGDEKYDFGIGVEYEYDVVECEDFVLDKGCWVRNMPEEIRLANPDFVPT